MFSTSSTDDSSATPRDKNNIGCDQIIIGGIDEFRGKGRTSAFNYSHGSGSDIIRQGIHAAAWNRLLDSRDILREGFYLKPERFQVIHVCAQADSVGAALPAQGRVHGAR